VQMLAHMPRQQVDGLMYMSAQSDNVLFAQSRNVLLTPFRLRRSTKDNY
jgi:hypothetical protein